MKLYTVHLNSAWVFFLLAAFFMLPSSASLATAGKWVAGENLRARLIAAYAEGEYLHGAIEIDLAPGWHTYWRSPGDAGIAPRFDWSMSENLGEVEIGWPTPRRFENSDIYTFGYSESVVFPFKIRKKAPEKGISLELKALIVTCKNICIPSRIDLSLPIENSFAKNDGHISIYKEAKEKLPHKGNIPGLKINTAVAGPEAFVVTAFMHHGPDEPDLFIEAENIAINSPPVVQNTGSDMRRVILKIPAPPEIDNLAGALAGKSVKVTIVNRGEAMEKSFSF
jgi:suppressor for copper-sensitivity B